MPCFMLLALLLPQGVLDPARGNLEVLAGPRGSKSRPTLPGEPRGHLPCQRSRTLRHSTRRARGSGSIRGGVAPPESSDVGALDLAQELCVGLGRAHLV